MALAFQLTGFFGTCVTVVKLVGEIKECHRENKAIANLSRSAEAWTDRVTSSAKRFASLVRHEPEHLDKLCRVVSDLESIKDNLEEKKVELLSKTKAARFFSAPKTTTTLKVVCTRLEHMESQLDIAGMVSAVDRKVDAMHQGMGLMAQGLATFLEKGGDTEEAQRLVRRVNRCIGSSTMHSSVGESGFFLLIMGKAYMEGQYAEQDFRKAATYFRQAMEHGNADAAYWMGVMLDEGRTGVPRNDTESFRFFLYAAKSGHAEALREVGDRYYHGNGVDRNVKEAFDSYVKAAERKSSGAMVEAGICCTRGFGTSVDLFEATKYFERAAELGNALGLTLYANCVMNGQGVTRNERHAVELVRVAAEADCVQAIRMLASCFETGRGVEKNDAEAVKLFRKAIKHGDKEALARLGQCLVEGTGVVQDVDEGKRYIREAVKANNTRAWMTYGYLLATGQGFLRNMGKAVLCFNRAAAGGLVAAHANLGVAYIQGDGVRRNADTAINHFLYAASYNLEYAQWRLALIFEKGIDNVPRDIDRALFYFRRLAELGHALSYRKTAQYILEGQGVERPRTTNDARKRICHMERVKRRFLRNRSKVNTWQ